jgi:hypothetical protein
MRRSPYDRDGDGSCDDVVCSHVAMIVGKDQADETEARLVSRDLRPLGIDLDRRSLGFGPFVRTVTDPSNRIALAIALGWVADYPNGSTFFEPLLSRPAAPAINRDLSLVGATSRQLQRWGYQVTRVPTIERRIAACRPLIGDEQLRCWALLDKFVMQRVVPWVPFFQYTSTFLVSNRVRDPVIDASVPGSLALDHLVLTPS